MRNVMTVLHSWLNTCGLSRQGGSPIVEARSGLTRRRRGAPSGEQSPEAAAQDRRPRSENRDLGVTHTSCDLHYGRVQGSLNGEGTSFQVRGGSGRGPAPQDHRSHNRSPSQAEPAGPGCQSAGPAGGVGGTRMPVGRPSRPRLRIPSTGRPVPQTRRLTCGSCDVVERGVMVQSVTVDPSPPEVPCPASPLPPPLPRPRVAPCFSGPPPRPRWSRSEPDPPPRSADSRTRPACTGWASGSTPTSARSTSGSTPGAWSPPSIPRSG